MTQWSGEPGGAGLLSSFADQRFEFGNKKFGRWSPVLASDGSVMLEPGERLVVHATASRVSELSEIDRGGPSQWTELWSQEGAIPIGITTRRLFFATAELPLHPVQQRVQARHGTQHAGHTRWIWVDCVECNDGDILLHLLTGDPSFELAADGPVRLHRTTMRVGFALPTASHTLADLLPTIMYELVSDRLATGGASGQNRERLMALQTDQRSWTERTDVPGALPHPYMSKAEYDEPFIARARDAGNVRGALQFIETPLRVQPLKPAEMRRIKKAFRNWTSGAGDPGQVRRWMHDMAPDFLAGIAIDPSVPTEVLAVLRTLHDPTVDAALDANPAVPPARTEVTPAASHAADWYPDRTGCIDSATSMGPSGPTMLPTDGVT